MDQQRRQKLDHDLSLLAGMRPGRIT